LPIRRTGMGVIHIYDYLLISPLVYKKNKKENATHQHLHIEHLDKLLDLITIWIIYGYNIKTCFIVALFIRTGFTLKAQKRVFNLNSERTKKGSSLYLAIFKIPKKPAGWVL